MKNMRQLFDLLAGGGSNPLNGMNIGLYFSCNINRAISFCTFIISPHPGLLPPEKEWLCDELWNDSYHIFDPLPIILMFAVMLTAYRNFKLYQLKVDNLSIIKFAHNLLPCGSRFRRQ